MNDPVAQTTAARTTSDQAFRRCRHLLSATRDLLFSIDRAYRHLEVNEAYLTAIDRTREETIGATVAELLGTAFFDATFKPSIDRCMTGQTFRQHTWVEYPGLGRQPLSIDYTPLVESDGSVPGIAVCARDATEYGEMQERLLRYQTFPELNPSAVFEVSPQGKAVYLNPRTRDLFPDLEARGFDHPLLAGIRGIVKKLRAQSQRTRVREIEIGDACYEQTITYLSNYDVLRFYTRDITDNRRSQDALRLSEERYKDFASIASDWDWEMDADLRFTYFSDRVEAIGGQRTDLLIGKTREEIQTDIGQDEKWQQHLADLAARREFRDFRYRVSSVSGELQWVSTNGRPRHDQHGTFLGYRGTGRLVTAEVQALETLEQVAHALEVKTAVVENIVETVVQGIGAFDKHGRLITANRHYQEVLQLPDHLVEPGSPHQDMAYYLAERGLYGDGDPGELSRERVAVLTSGQPTSAELTGANGRIYESSSRPIADGGFVITYTDVTERVRWTRDLEQARDAAENASLAKSVFLAKMSHEIRTPMNAIIGMLLLALDTELNLKQRDYLTKAHASSQALLAIINDILDFSKIEAGKLRIESVEFELDEVLENTAAIVGMLAREKGLELHFSVGSEVPSRFIGDPLRLGQILLNLTTNAAKFTERGEILVEVSARSRCTSGTELRFRVQDTGIGMSERHLARLFDHFTQADDSTSRRFGGTGLGLAICKQLVEMMNGKIEVDSALGEGTTVTFALPLDVVEGVTSEQTPAASLESMRVLVVDDSSSARDIMTRQLEALSMQVTAISSGPEALRELARAREDGSPYKLAFVDWNMPEMDGLETARRIKNAMRPDRTLPVVMVTGFDREDLLSRPGSEAIDQVLTKPIGRSALHNALLSAVGAQDRKNQFAHGLRTRSRTSVQRLQDRQELRGARVLVVDDHSINRQIIKELLMRASIETDEAANGLEAVDSVNRQGDGPPYDVILMDVQMPEMDGYRATRLIRERWDAVQLPIIAITAHAMAEERERCLEAGMNDHVSKPVDPEQLMNALQRCVSLPLRDLDRRPSAAVAAAAAADQESPALPDRIDGIDIDSGLDRVSGNRELYVKLLIEFGVRAQELVTGLFDELRRGDREAAGVAAHSLKGLAGNVSANALHSAAAALEAVLRSDDSNSLEALTLQIKAALQEVLTSLEGIGHSTIEALAQEPPLRRAPSPKLAKKLKHLSNLVSAHDLKASSYYKAILGEYDLSSCQIEAMQIERDLDQLRYEPALEAVKRIIDLLDAG